MPDKRQTFGDRMAALKNTRHEKFAQLIAEGKTQQEAHRLSGYKPCAASASEIRNNPNVAERIAYLQEQAASETVFGLAQAVAQIDEDRAFAKELQQPSAAISASNTKFKLLGLITDKAVVDLRVSLQQALDQVGGE